MTNSISKNAKKSRALNVIDTLPDDMRELLGVSGQNEEIKA